MFEQAKQKRRIRFLFLGEVRMRRWLNSLIKCYLILFVRPIRFLVKSMGRCCQQLKAL